MPFGTFTLYHTWHEQANSSWCGGSATLGSTRAGQPQCSPAEQGQGRGTDVSQHTHQTQCRLPPGRQCQCHSPCLPATGRCREPCAWSPHQTPDRTGGCRGDIGCQDLQTSFTCCRASGAPGEPEELLVGRGTLSGHTKRVTKAGKALWLCSHQLCQGQGSITSPLSWQCSAMKRLYVL